MADLARIKRNVAKMASMNAPEEDIDGYIASEGVTIDDVRNYRELKPMTEEQKMQAQEMAQQMRPEKTFGDKVSEFLVTNPIARQVGFGLQGIANAGLNPAGYVARAAGIDTKPLEAQTDAERITELAGQYGYDAAVMAEILKGYAPEYISGTGLTGNVVRTLAEGGTPLALTTSIGSAIATGLTNPQNPYVRMLTDTIGGGLGAGLTRPKFTAPKQDVKTVKELTKSIGEDALNRDISEAERTGRNLLEVGGDEVMQAAQQARQQSPEARKIITDSLESSIAEQPTRTRGVINEALGTKGKNATIAQVMENAKAEAQPIYKELEDIGDLAKYETRDLPQQNFNRWNAGNAIVDENSKPLDLYHGTRANFDAFDISKAGQSNGGISKIGFWLTPEKQIAKEFSNTWYGGNKPRVIQTYVNMKNPKVYKSVDNTNALKKIESDINNVKNKMQEIKGKMSDSDLSQLRGFMQYDDYDEVAKMYGYSSETAKNARNYWDFDKQLDDLLFEKRVLKANDSYDQLMNDLDEYSEFVQHIDGVKDFRRGSHISRIAIKNPDEAVAKLKERLKKEGYDGIIIENTNRDTDVIGKNATQYIAFEPNQIKSVKNSGAWSESPSLTDAGWTPESQSQLANAIKNNDVLSDTISRVKRANSSLKNLPDTDFRVVNEARKALSQASMNRTELSGYEARQALNELDPILNNITGGKLAQANKLYSDAYQFERAADLGRDVFNSRKSPDDLKTAWNSLSSTEKQAAKIGLREEVMNKIGSATNETNALNRFLPENVREKITTIAGNKEGGRIIDEAEQAVKLRRNYNKLTSGSQTSEKQSLRDTLRGIRGFVRNPWETTVDALAKPFDTKRNIRMAEYLTENPTSLKDAFNRVNMANRMNAERMPRRTPYLQSALRAIIEEK